VHRLVKGAKTAFVGFTCVYPQAMDKPWLSRLLDDSAFPLLALAVAVSQVNLGADKKSNLLHYENRPSELQLDGRFQQNAGNPDTSMPSGSPRATERRVWTPDPVRKE
jgi:hypothetical protein